MFVITYHIGMISLQRIESRITIYEIKFNSLITINLRVIKQLNVIL